MEYTSLKNKPFFILGPCVAESVGLLSEVSDFILQLKKKYEVEIIFKASFDKANRTSGSSFRGPGMDTGLQMLSDVKSYSGLPVLSDIHESYQAAPVAEVCDILQIPAFLCRQTDLLHAAGNTGKIVNIKKAQFLSGIEMQYPLEKVRETGNEQIMLTERGTMFGYNNLVVDYRNMIDMQQFAVPVIFDATHSVQRPGGAGGKSGGNREYVASLAKAAKAIGIQGFFFEIHPDPDHALSDGPNMLNFNQMETLISELI